MFSQVRIFYNQKNKEGSPFNIFCVSRSFRLANYSGHVIQDTLHTIVELWHRGRKCPVTSYSMARSLGLVSRRYHSRRLVVIRDLCTAPPRHGFGPPCNTDIFAFSLLVCARFSSRCVVFISLRENLPCSYFEAKASSTGPVG